MKLSVGDRVKIKKDSTYYGAGITNPEDVNGIVDRLRSSYYNYYVKWDNGQADNYPDGHLELVEQGKIIGYELLKDGPTVNKGTKYTFDGEEYVATGKYGQVTIHEEALKDTTWFKPIYEPIKPTSIEVVTKAGIVTVTKFNLNIKGEVPVTIASAKAIFEHLKKFSAITIKDSYTVTVNTFNVGCKVFSFDDIKPLEEAIKKVS